MRRKETLPSKIYGRVWMSLEVNIFCRSGTEDINRLGAVLLLNYLKTFRFRLYGELSGKSLRVRRCQSKQNQRGSLTSRIADLRVRNLREILMRECHPST